MVSTLQLLSDYGYIVLFVALLLELIALPLPGELLMTYCGFLVYQNKLYWWVSVLLSFLGAALGITASYFIGRFLGKTFFEKHGHYFHLTPKRLNMASQWFDRFGKKLLVVAFFIPGIRHITGYFSGIFKFKFRDFAKYAYTGALIWTSTFITLGKIIGPQWEAYHNLITKHLTIISIIILSVMVLVYVMGNFWKRIIAFVVDLLRKGLSSFQYTGRVKIIILSFASIFLILSGTIIAIIQKYFSGNFKEFDDLTTYLIDQTFDSRWYYVMKIFESMSSIYTLVIISMLSMLWIIYKKFDRSLEIKFILINLLGGFAFEKILSLLFQKLDPLGVSLNENIQHNFPSKEALISTIIYGFSVYLILRNMKKIIQGATCILMIIIICGVIGLSLIYSDKAYASGIIAGYVFGGIWISVNIVLMEILRLFPLIRNNNLTKM